MSKYKVRLTSDYRKMHSFPLDLSKLHRTKRAKAALLKMFCNDHVRFLFSPLSENGGKKEKPFLTGTHLVSIDGAKFLYSISVEDGRILNNLFDAGLIEVDCDTPAPSAKMVIFKLSEEVRVTKRREVYRYVVLADMKRILMQDLRALASAYGLDVKHKKIYRLFKITKKDGSRLCRDDSLTHHPITNEPIYKQSDLTMLEWDDLFYKFYLKYLAVKK